MSRELALDVYRKSSAIHSEMYVMLSKLRDYAQSPQTIEDLTDVTYLLKKSHDLIHDLKKELDGAKTLLERTTCLIAITREQVDKIRTDIVTGSPHLTMGANAPSMKKDPEKFFEFCEAIGVSREVAASDVFRLHWPGMKEYLTELQAKGEPLPAGIDPDKTYPVYTLRCLPARGVDLDEYAGQQLRKNENE